MIVGLISDTHGLLRPEALEALRGADAILHAGDIGGPRILAALAAIAPVHAVRGNNDAGTWAAAVPERVRVRLGGQAVYLLHDVKDLDVDPAADGVAIVVSGHSHAPKIERRDGVLYVNPGSAGPRRFKLPISVGRLTLGTGLPEAAIVRLEPAPERK